MLLDRVGENNPQDCFLPQAKPAPSLFESLANKKEKAIPCGTAFSFLAESKGFEPSNRL
jgi:hypothetical protein